MTRADISVNELCARGSLTEAHKEICDVHHVRWISGGVVVHFVLLPGMVSDDVQENIDRRLAVLGSRAVTVPRKRPGRGREKWQGWNGESIMGGCET